MTRMSYSLIISAILTVLFLAGCGDRRTTNTQNHSDMSSGNENTEVQSYTCPMHPHFISTDKDAPCPICGMDLVPAAGNQSVPTDGGVAVSPEMIQTMGIRTATVSRTDFGGDIRAYGQVEANTRLETATTSRLEGWVERLSVKAEGDVVRHGALLYQIYSPTLIGAQKDYLASLKIGNANRIASVRQRLKSLGMQESTIKRLTATQTLVERIPVYSEHSGTVSMLHIREGDFVKPGTPIMRLQSYDTVWVLAEVNETDLPAVKADMPVRLKFDSAMDAAETGTVDYIYPTIDPKTRTANIRIVVDNSSGSLRPGAYADVIIQDGSTTDRRLSVPTQAILRDSSGAHVVVALGDGRFASRDITVGISGNGRTEVTSGLNEGEQIVASGQFMLDSESNLREGLSKLQVSKASFDGETALSDLPIDVTRLSQIDHLVDAALYFHEALIDGYPIDPYFLDPTIAMSEQLQSELAGSRLSPILNQAKSALDTAKIEKQGQGLADSLSALTVSLEPWLIRGAPSHYKSKGLILYADPASGQLWLQHGGLPANPYGGNGGDEIPWPDPMAGMETP